MNEEKTKFNVIFDRKEDESCFVKRVNTGKKYIRLRKNLEPDRKGYFRIYSIEKKDSNLFVVNFISPHSGGGIDYHGSITIKHEAETLYIYNVSVIESIE